MLSISKVALIERIKAMSNNTAIAELGYVEPDILLYTNFGVVECEISNISPKTSIKNGGTSFLEISLSSLVPFEDGGNEKEDCLFLKKVKIRSYSGGTINVGEMCLFLEDVVGVSLANIVD